MYTIHINMSLALINSIQGKKDYIKYFPYGVNT